MSIASGEISFPSRVPDSNTLLFEVYTEENYYEALTDAIHETSLGEYISLATMALDADDPRVKLVLEATLSAANRGALTAIAVDNFALLDKNPSIPLGMPAGGGIGYGLGFDPLNGVEYRNNGLTMFAGVTNYPLGILVSTYHGRSHIKAAAVGNVVFVGGASLDATERLDAAVSVTNPDLAYQVNRFIRQSIIKRSVRHVLGGDDIAIQFSPDSCLMIDAGIRGQSAILAEAIDIIDNAQDERLVYSSEQFPTGKIGSHLLDAYERGVDVIIASNDPSKHDRYRAFHDFIMKVERRSKPASFFEHQVPFTGPTLHTKIVASQTRALVGSHSLNSIGVRLGTAEMDISTHNPEFVSAIGNVVIKQIS